MAQNNPALKRNVDIDNTAITPIPELSRNYLTLEEKIAVINAYDQRPMYRKLSRMFNCSKEQIKSIVKNRKAIMDFYYGTKSKKQMIDQPQIDLKQRKIQFLEECLYECLKRLQYHAKKPISEELINCKTLEFLDVLPIPEFTPTKKWLNLFKASYNISLSNKQIAIYSKPESSLDINDIMAFCTKHKTSNTSLHLKCNKDDNENAEYEAKRSRKLKFMQEVLKEYLLRVKFHHKSMKLDTASLCQVAREFNEILKVQDFEPTIEWIVELRKRYESEGDLANVKRPPLSLDLKDIISYCSRIQNKSKENTVTLAPKETALQMRVMPKYPNIGKILPESGLKFQQNSILYLEEQGGRCGGGGEKAAKSGENDVKPNIKEIHVKRPQLEHSLSSVKSNIKTQLEQPPPLKIRKIESINNDPELQRKFQANSEIHKTPIVTLRETHKEPSKPPAKTVIYIQKVHGNIPKPNIDSLTPLPSNVQIKNEKPTEDNNYILPNNTIIRPASPPQLRIQQVHAQVPLTCLSPKQEQLSPPSSQITDDNYDGVELPRHVTCFKDALMLLKPLEEYAMLRENYRAIGLITQLEEVLKCEPVDENTGDEEFIG